MGVKGEGPTVRVREKMEATLIWRRKESIRVTWKEDHTV